MNPNGRRPLYPGQTIQRLVVGVNDSLLDNIEDEVIKNKSTLSETVRRILQAYFDTERINAGN
jgi:metal-responsive CopG/Arc/MetJ family transcriptional regulator